MILEKQRDKSRQKKNAVLKSAQKSWFEEDVLIPLQLDVSQTGRFHVSMPMAKET